MAETRTTGRFQPVQGYILNTVEDRDRLYMQFDLFFESFRSDFDRALHLAGINTDPEAAKFRVVDLGCGEALHLADIRSRYPRAQVVGIDRDIEAITIARSAFGGLGDVHFYLQDVHEPFPTEWEPGVPGSGFDVAQLRYALAHFNAKVVLAHVWAALRPGGVICLLDPMEKSVEFPHPSAMRLAKAINDGWQRFPGTFDAGARYRELLAAAGYEVLDTNIQSHEMGGTTVRGWSFLTLFLNLAISMRRALVDITKVIPAAEFDQHLVRLRTECTPEMVGYWAVGQAIGRKPL